MSAHTPGPWKVESITGVEVHGMARSFHSVEASGYHAGGGIALVRIAAHPEQSLANARLIAAAPALLEALEVIAINCEIGEPVNWRDLGKAARAAIAQAKGESK